MPESNRGHLMVASRNVTNWVKADLINTYARPGFDVLDLGFGRGGDIHKYCATGIRSLTGVDISHQSLQHAKGRINARSTDDVEVHLIEADMTFPLALERRADVVFCMFAMHYAFQSAPAARVFFRNARTALGVPRPYKRLVCITVDETRLEPGYRSSILAVGPVTPPGPDGLGEAYSFWYKGCVDHVTEWVVRTQALRTLTESEGFAIETDMNLMDYYMARSPIQVALSDDEVYACRLYRIVIFSPV